MSISHSHDSARTIHSNPEISGQCRRQVAFFGFSEERGHDLKISANEIGLSMRHFPLHSLNDDVSLNADIACIKLDDAPDVAWLEKLYERTEAENLNLIFELSEKSLDSVYPIFGDCENVTFLVEPTDADRLLALASSCRAAGNMLNSPMAEVRDRQLEQLHSEVQRIAQLLARLNGDNGAPAGQLPPAPRLPASPFIEDHVHSPVRGFSAQMAPDPSLPSVSPRTVRSIIRQRRLRDEFFSGEMFADPAWDMLLDLYAAKLERIRVSVSSLCIASAVPATTALRWIKTLTDTGVFDREADPHDGRRIFVTLSKDTIIAMNRYFARVSDELLPI